MFNIFRSKKGINSKKRNELALISIHIPKTAGTSFRNILKEVYGEEQVIRLDISPTTGIVEINEESYEASALPKKIRVLHGHFYYLHLTERFEIDANIPVIAWLRDPVQRVLSNYYYLRRMLDVKKDQEKTGFLKLMEENNWSLLDYAKDERNRNWMHKFLTGLSLEDFFFVGIQEHFSDDLSRLAQLLEWKNYKEFQHNQTSSKKRDHPQEVLEQIIGWNQYDVELYKKALQLRAARISQK